MNLKYDIISSGSSGNSSVFRLGKKFIFVDMGLPLNQIQPFIEEKIEDNELSNLDIDEIILFITHEHSDHIAGMKPFLSRYSPKIYASTKTVERLIKNGFDEDLFYSMDADVEVTFNDFSVKPFRIKHDAVEPFGYRFKFDGVDISYLTDVGIISDYIYKAVEETEMIILESNYDPELLQNSKYPNFLKTRIASSFGHLSNQDAHNLICKLSMNKLKEAVLVHVSENCNSYELVQKYAESCFNDFNVVTTVAKQKEIYSII